MQKDQTIICVHFGKVLHYYGVTNVKSSVVIINVVNTSDNKFSVKNYHLCEYNIGIPIIAPF